MKFTLITYQGCEMLKSTKIKNVLRLRLSSGGCCCDTVISVRGATDNIFYPLHSYQYLRYPLEN